MTQCRASAMPAKPIRNSDVVSVHFNYFLLHSDLQQTKEGLSAVT